LDQQQPSALAANFVLHEAEQQLPESEPLLPRIDRDPVEIERPVGHRRRTVADVALHLLVRSAVRFLEHVNNVIALLGMLHGGRDELVRDADLFFRESIGGGEDLVDAVAVPSFDWTNLHGRRRRARAAMISAFRNSGNGTPAAWSARRKP